MHFGSLEIIAKACVPVLLPDTCIILDIVRSPRRDNVDGPAMLAAKSIHQALCSTKKIACVISQQVFQELDENRPSVLDDTNKSLQKLLDEISRIDEWSKALEHHSHTDLSHLSNCVPVAEKLISEIISHSPNADISDEIAGRAFARMMEKRTPAKTGKDSSKDCIVVESYLEVSRKLRAFGHRSDIIFASSNTKEFVSGADKSLNRDIADEFSKLGIIYARALHETNHRLGLRK